MWFKFRTLKMAGSTAVLILLHSYCLLRDRERERGGGGGGGGKQERVSRRDCGRGEEDPTGVATKVLTLQQASDHSADYRRRKKKEKKRIGRKENRKKEKEKRRKEER